MRKVLFQSALTFCTLFLLSFLTNAQPWTYDFGTSSGSANNTNSASGNTAFFTGTPANGGTYRVRVGSGGGSIALVNPGTSLGTDTELQLNAATGSSTNKFSVYNWSTLTTQVYLKTKLRTTSTSSGSFAIFVSTNPVGSANTSYTGDYAGTLASCWITYGSGAITGVSRRNAGVTAAISSSGFLKDTDQDVEFFCNNASTSVNYYKNGTTYTLNAQSWDMWVGGTKISATGGWAKAASIVADVNLGSLNFYAESSLTNSGFMYLDDLEYTNALPQPPIPSITLSSPSQVASGNVTQGTQNEVLSKFQVSVSNANDQLSSIICTTAGTYTSSDITGFSLYYNPTADDVASATLLSTASTVVSGGTLSFSGLSTTINNGSTGYFYVMANFSGSAVAGNTINIAANPNLLFAAATPSGSITAGGVKTIEASLANDCAGVPGGSALPGTSCDDANACTINDVWSASCVCAGTIQDTDGDGTCDATDECDNDPNKILAGACGCGNVEVGQTCNDNNACTENDVITSCGVCAGTALVDTDNDGTCDLTDECDNDPNKILAGTCGCGSPEPTSTCDDGVSLTTNDVINSSCVCEGIYPHIYYDFTTADTTYTTFPNAEGSAVSRGNNNGTTTLITSTSNSGTNYSGSSAGGNAGAAARVGALNTNANGSAYFEFTVFADANYSLTINEIRFGTRSTSTGPQSFSIRSSLDGFNADLVTTSAATGSWVLKSMPLTSFITLPGVTVTFRLYGYDGAGSASANTANWRIDDLYILGYSTYTEPSSIVQFDSPIGSGLESVGSVSIPVTMDSAPASAVQVLVSDLLTGSASTNDYSFSPINLTFLPTETYPNTQNVTLNVVSDSDVESSETIEFGLSLVSGTATLGTSNFIYTINNDDLAQLVINEIDYDNAGTDNSEWIEIKNNGSSAVDINGYKLELVNGGNTPATVYTTLTLASTSTLIQPGGYFVVGNNAAIANINLVVTPTSNLIQNGPPDAIALKDNSNNLLDAVSYEGNTAGVYTEGATANTLIDAGSTNFPSGTIGRFPDGADTGDNMVDLITLCVGTPGASNTPSTSTYYQDFDADAFGNADSTVAACEAPFGYVVDNTDCNDTSAVSNTSATEICDGLDNDCSGTADNGLAFANYYNDADGDTYGAGTATNACQSPGATYVTNNTDCDDASSTAYPGGTEVCGNSIDEDCSGADLACPTSGFTAAVNVLNIGQFGTGVQSSQTVNLSTGTNTIQSPGLGLDKWFSFTASANAMRIAVVGSSLVEDDNDLSLYETPTDPTVQLIPLVSENDVHPGSTGAAADGGSETLIYDQLIVGDVYYLCVRNNNNTAGNVSLTLSNLNASTTDIALYTNGTNTFTSACQNFKVKFRPNSAGYTINRWNSADISGTPSWSYAIPVTSTVASTICQLGKIAPANLSGSNQTVYVTVDVLYNLTDAFGTVTPATARANAAASFQMANEADLNVRTTDRCAAGFKSTTSSIATNRSVCGTTRYVWEMSMVYPQTSLPLEVQGPVGGSRILMLNSVPALANGQRYDVRIASKHIDGATQTAYGTTQCVKTLGAAGMPTIEEEINVYERSENGVTTSIYPNPNNGSSVNLNVEGLEGELQVRITDATGRMVYSNRYMVEGAMNTTMDFGQTLAGGVYMVEMVQNGQLNTMRMVVSK